MNFLQMLLVLTALTLAYSYPTGLEQNPTTFAPNVTNTTHDVPEDKKPLTIIVEDKTPKTESVLVEFIYNSNGGNSISESKGTDKDKYNVQPFQQKDQIKKFNANDNEKTAAKQKQVNEPQLDSSRRVSDLYMRAQTALIPKELSPITEEWPKYFYDAFNPVHPFPEIQYEKNNQISAQKVNNENTDSYLPYDVKERKAMNIAGPLLSPLSFYDREFRVPIFD